MRVLVETSCLVALALPDHEHHVATLDALERRRAARQEFVIAAHSLVEAYSVLTRLPAPERLAPQAAFDLLESNWGKSEMVALTAAESWRVLREHAVTGTQGGRVYDGIIAHCGRRAGVDQILTWNLRHFATSAIPAVSPAMR